jgi:hypothetical protein
MQKTHSYFSHVVDQETRYIVLYKNDSESLFLTGSDKMGVLSPLQDGYYIVKLGDPHSSVFATLGVFIILTSHSYKLFFRGQELLRFTAKSKFNITAHGADVVDVSNES